MRHQCAVYDRRVLLGHWKHHLLPVKVYSLCAHGRGLLLRPEQSTSLSCVSDDEQCAALLSKKNLPSAAGGGEKKMQRHGISPKHCHCPWHQGSGKQSEKSMFLLKKMKSWPHVGFTLTNNYATFWSSKLIVVLFFNASEPKILFTSECTAPVYAVKRLVGDKNTHLKVG